MYNWDITKNCLDFGDLDLIFKVTAGEKLKIQDWSTSVFFENTVTSSYFSPLPDTYSAPDKMGIHIIFPGVPTMYVFMEK